MKPETKAAPLSDDDVDDLAQQTRTNTAASRMTHGEVVGMLRWMEGVGQNFTPLPPPSSAVAEETEPEDEDEPPTPRRTRW
jgi:hypothetical protein